MKNVLSLSAFVLVAGAMGNTNLRAAEVSQSDPFPNAGGDGGIGYHWTVKMGLNDRAELLGTVGAWSWDEDGFPETAKGWTHTSNWIAFELTEEARLTLLLQRKAGVPTGQAPNASNPDGTGLFNLFPAFSIYKSWQDSGADSHNFNNRGDIEWAPDVSYHTHVENDGSHSVARTFRLPAGKYSIAMGGNSPSVEAEGRQGYEAILTTDFPQDASELIMPGKKRYSTTRQSMTLGGKLENPESVETFLTKCNGKTRMARLAGRKWTARIKKLKAGRNRVRLIVISQQGSARNTGKVEIHRIVPEPVEDRIPSRFGTL